MPVTTPQGTLDFKKVDRVTFVGASSNTVIDTTTGSLGVGVGVGGPTSNLHVVGNALISSNLTVGESVETKNINMLHTSNTASIKLNSNVVAEFPRSKKLIKYPRVALTDNDQPTGYVASASTSNSADYNAYKAFNNTYESDTTSGWASDSSTFNNQDPTGSAVSFNGDSGEYLTIQLPNKIKLETHHLFGRQDIRTNEFPVSAKLYASNDNFTNFELIESYEDLTQPTSSTEAQVHNINETRYFQYYRLMITKTSGTQTYAAVGEWELYGVPEYDPEAHGTDVTIKSVANVPNTDWLEVYYDAKDYTIVTTTVDNKTGVSAYDATSVNSVGFDETQKAFTFDAASSQYLSSGTPVDGNYIHSISIWFKGTNLTPTTGDTLMWIGDNANNERIEIYLESDKISYSFKDNDVVADIPLSNNRWYHLTVTYNGVAGVSGREIYLDGVKQPTTHTGNSAVLAVDNNTLNLGGFSGTSTDYMFSGSIANFRLFNRALSSDEVYQLYAYQKEDFGHGDLSMTLKNGRLGIGTSEPRAALDVSGDLTVSGESYFNNVGGVFNVTGRTTTRRLNEINFVIPPISNSSHQQFFWLAQFNELQWAYSEYLRFEYNLHYSKNGSQHNRGVTSGGYAIIATRSGGASGTGTQYDNESPLVRRVEYKSYRIFAEGPDFYYVRNTTKSMGYLVMGFRSTRTGVITDEKSRLTGTIQYNGNLDNIQTFNGTVYKHGAYAVTTGASHSTLFPSVINDNSFIAESGDTVTLHEASTSTTYFTGQHTTYIEDLPDLTNHENNNGLIVSSNKNDYIHLTNHKIRGKEAITQDESLPITSLSTRPNDKTCFGVMSCKPFDEYSEKRFCVVNSLGEGAIWVINTNGNLEAGDYITTSNLTGYGQKQDDDILRNYTVAKITMDCNFNPISRPIKEILRSENGEYILDEDDQIQWTNTDETEMQYNIRYVDANSTIISQDEYMTKLSEGENVYIAAYVGCTYHCG